VGHSLGVCGGGPSSLVGAGSGPSSPLVKGSGGLCSPFLGCGGKPLLLLVVMVLVGPRRHLVVACHSSFSCHVVLAVVVAIDEAMAVRWRRGSEEATVARW